MREDGRVTFVTTQGGAYNPRTHQYDPVTEVEKVKACHISDLGLDESVRVFGNYQEHRKVIRFGQPYLEHFDFIRYQGKQYKALLHRLDKTVFYIEADSVVTGE